MTQTSILSADKRRRRRPAKSDSAQIFPPGAARSTPAQSLLARDHLNWRMPLSSEVRQRVKIEASVDAGQAVSAPNAPFMTVFVGPQICEMDREYLADLRPDMAALILFLSGQLTRTSDAAIATSST